VRLGEDGKRQLVGLRWGLIPNWAKDAKIAYSTLNARADTVATKPAFRSAYKKRRCLIVADGYYEWLKDGKDKQPILYEVDGGEPIAFAGYWEWRPGTAGKDEPIESCTIITTEANVGQRGPRPDAGDPQRIRLRRLLACKEVPLFPSRPSHPIKAGKVVLPGPDIEAREEALVARLLTRAEPVSVIVLGAAHNEGSARTTRSRVPANHAEPGREIAGRLDSHCRCGDCNRRFDEGHYEQSHPFESWPD
jgi:hypothetical protein